MLKRFKMSIEERIETSFTWPGSGSLAEENCNVLGEAFSVSRTVETVEEQFVRQMKQLEGLKVGEMIVAIHEHGFIDGAGI